MILMQVILSNLVMPPKQYTTRRPTWSSSAHLYHNTTTILVYVHVYTKSLSIRYPNNIIMALQHLCYFLIDCPNRSVGFRLQDHGRSSGASLTGSLIESSSGGLHSSSLKSPSSACTKDFLKKIFLSLYNSVVDLS